MPGDGIGWHFRGEYDASTRTVVVHKAGTGPSELTQVAGAGWRLVVVAPNGKAGDTDAANVSRRFAGAPILVVPESVEHARLVADDAIRSHLARRWVGVPRVGGGLVAATREIATGAWVEVDVVDPLEPHEVVIALDTLVTSMLASIHRRRLGGEFFDLSRKRSIISTAWAVWCSGPLTIIADDRTATVTLSTYAEPHHPASFATDCAFPPLPTAEELERDDP